MRRTLLKNKTPFWLVKQTGYIDAVDSNGNYTGDKSKLYGAPVEVMLSVYPNNGDLKQMSGGILAEFDYVAVDTEAIIEPNDILFSVPTWNSAIAQWGITDDYWGGVIYLPSEVYDKHYTYRIDKVLSSINVNFYGLRARV